MRKSVLIAALAFVTPAFAQPLNAPGEGGHTVRGPSLALSIQAAQAAIAACKTSGYLVGVTIVDDQGGVRLSMTADGAPTQGSNGSRRKATLSAIRKASGAELAKQVQTDPALAAQIKDNHDWLARPGSLLIRKGNDVVGAIAVEGNPHDLAKDISCAQAGLKVIEAGQG